MAAKGTRRRAGRVEKDGIEVAVRLPFQRVGMDKVGIRFSPNILSQGVEDSDPIPLFNALAARLEDLNVPWIELREAHRPTSAGAIPTAPVSGSVRSRYSGTILLNSDYDGRSARERMAEGVADGISFGRPFIANPDLVDRIAVGAPFSFGDATTFYAGGAGGSRRCSPLVRYPRSVCCVAIS